MRGEILSFDDMAGTGMISGDDGIRYGFDRSAVTPPADIKTGLRVDFVPDNGSATQVMLLAAAAPAANFASASGGAVAGGGYDFASAMFSFNGRLRRQHFWISWLILLGVGVVLGWIPILGPLISLVLIWPNLAISVKRLHDMGKTGWLILAPFGINIVLSIVAFGMIGMSAMANAQAFENEDPAAIMALMGPALGLFGLMLLVNLAFLLWIGITDSTPGENKYGPNPKGL